MHIYIYICIHIHVCIYIYIYTYNTHQTITPDKHNLSSTPITTLIFKLYIITGLYAAPEAHALGLLPPDPRHDGHAQRLHLVQRAQVL